MKYLATFLLLFSIAVRAGDYYGYSIDSYDPVTGLYYKAVEKTLEDGGLLSSKTSRSTVVNISIYDPATGASTLLFKEPQSDSISMILFETGFKDTSIEFYGSSATQMVKNNSRVDKREPKNKLLISVVSKDNKASTLFTSDKKGEGLKKLASVPPSADWHLDVKNSKVRVVTQLGTSLRIESYDW